MAALAWLLIPVVAAVAAALWGGWAGRRRAKMPDTLGVAGYERFRAAMERSGAKAAPSRPGSAVRYPAPPGAVGTSEGHQAGPTVSQSARMDPQEAALAPAGALAHAAPDGPAPGAD